MRASSGKHVVALRDQGPLKEVTAEKLIHVMHGRRGILQLRPHLIAQVQRLLHEVGIGGMKTEDAVVPHLRIARNLERLPAQKYLVV